VEIQVLSWHRNKNVAGFNQFMNNISQNLTYMDSRVNAGSLLAKKVESIG
jgi:hypothetical protein